MIGDCLCQACWLAWTFMAEHPGGVSEHGLDEQSRHWVMVRDADPLFDWLFDAEGRQMAVRRAEEDARQRAKSL